jgi:hypothetical protein
MHKDDKLEHDLFEHLSVEHQVLVVDYVKNDNYFFQLISILFDRDNHINGILFYQSMYLLMVVVLLVDELVLLIFEHVSRFILKKKTY